MKGLLQNAIWILYCRAIFLRLINDAFIKICCERFQVHTQDHRIFWVGRNQANKSCLKSGKNSLKLGYRTEEKAWNFRFKYTYFLISLSHWDPISCLNKCQNRLSQNLFLFILLSSFVCLLSMFLKPSAACSLQPHTTSGITKQRAFITAELQILCISVLSRSRIWFCLQRCWL